MITSCYRLTYKPTSFYFVLLTNENWIFLSSFCCVKKFPIIKLLISFLFWFEKWKYVDIYIFINIILLDIILKYNIIQEFIIHKSKAQEIRLTLTSIECLQISRISYCLKVNLPQYPNFKFMMIRQLYNCKTFM